MTKKLARGKRIPRGDEFELCDCAKFGVNTPDTDYGKGGYDWHQHEIRFACCDCDKSKGYYRYVGMRKPWHDMSEKEKWEEIDWAKSLMKICPECGKEPIMI